MDRSLSNLNLTFWLGANVYKSYVVRDDPISAFVLIKVNPQLFLQYNLRGFSRELVGANLK